MSGHAVWWLAPQTGSSAGSTHRRAGAQIFHTARALSTGAKIRAARLAYLARLPTPGGARGALQNLP
eukprot:13761663-Alexandrium_andersonii.AAC.1